MGGGRNDRPNGLTSVTLDPDALLARALDVRPWRTGNAWSAFWRGGVMVGGLDILLEDVFFARRLRR
jgi:hypothetical protein